MNPLKTKRIRLFERILWEFDIVEMCKIVYMSVSVVACLGSDYHSISSSAMSIDTHK
jgi:hypothetical protein